MKEIPNNKPRIISGLGNPEEIFNLIELGVDLFNTNYPNIITEWGNAFTFPLTYSSPFESEIQFKINLRHKKYQLDSQPLVPKCKCFTCENHSRAYIHHLLNVHELLASVLLTVHNNYYYLELFKVIRETISKGIFKSYKEYFLNKIYFT